ncbi:hypothetical protein BCPG_03494 [Burkholderia cenocepacia PC184]|nr:hypothetical protein BCPG_03494 [Burkholderia cenocepacia PC184]
MAGGRMVPARRVANGHRAVGSGRGCDRRHAVSHRLRDRMRDRLVHALGARDALDRHGAATAMGHRMRCGAVDDRRRRCPDARGRDRHRSWLQSIDQYAADPAAGARRRRIGGDSHRVAAFSRLRHRARRAALYAHGAARVSLRERHVCGRHRNRRRGPRHGLRRMAARRRGVCVVTDQRALATDSLPGISFSVVNASAMLCWYATVASVIGCTP